MSANLVIAQAGNTIPLLGSHSLVSMMIVIVILGVCLYFINQYIPMAAPIKTLLTVVVVLVIVLWLLRTFALI
jgi:hypothetical protein